MQAKVLKSAYLLAIGVMLTMIATKVWSQTPNSQTDFQRSFSVSTSAKLVVENYKGTIHVTGTEAIKSRWTFTKNSRAARLIANGGLRI